MRKIATKTAETYDRFRSEHSLVELINYIFLKSAKIVLLNIFQPQNVSYADRCAEILVSKLMKQTKLNICNSNLYKSRPK